MSLLRSLWKSCDTFVILPPHTQDHCIVFGKNSDRPDGEVQEIAYYPACDYQHGDKLKCTYIEVEQAAHTYAVVLSKPSWMWGAEMGANEHGVCIGNEAVWTTLNSRADLIKKLLGMDLLRLGLERAENAKQAVEVIGQLLEKYGQGGSCSSDGADWTYHNSFLIADRKEAWVLETAGQLWAAEHVTCGYRNISNSLSIGTKIDLCSTGLMDYAKQKNLLCDGKLDFADAFSSSGPDYRFERGRQLLKQLGAQNTFGVRDMMSICRDDALCMDGGFTTASSQVSVMYPPGDSRHCHWFTGAPNTKITVFKPFVFSSSPAVGVDIVSEKTRDAGGGLTHKLYEFNRKYAESRMDWTKSDEIQRQLRQMEENSIVAMEECLKSKDCQFSDMNDLLGHMVEMEINFLSSV